MADEEEDNIWKRKYLTLESRLKSVELVSPRFNSLSVGSVVIVD